MGGNKVGRYRWILQVVIPYGANLHPDTKVNEQREGWNSVLNAAFARKHG